MLTKLMDISATVRLDSQESTVKLVSTPFNFECLRVNAYKNRLKSPINGTSPNIDFACFFAHR